MAGSHEVRGSIPLCSTIMNKVIRNGWPFLLVDLRFLIEARHAARASHVYCIESLNAQKPSSTMKLCLLSNYPLSIFGAECATRTADHIPRLPLTRHCAAVFCPWEGVLSGSCWRDGEI